jgi:hypothetical protein
LTSLRAGSVRHFHRQRLREQFDAGVELGTELVGDDVLHAAQGRILEVVVAAHGDDAGEARVQHA